MLFPESHLFDQNPFMIVEQEIGTDAGSWKGCSPSAASEQSLVEGHALGMKIETDVFSTYINLSASLPSEKAFYVARFQCFFRRSLQANWPFLSEVFSHFFLGERNCHFTASFSSLVTRGSSELIDITKFYTPRNGKIFLISLIKLRRQLSVFKFENCLQIYITSSLQFNNI